MTTTTKRLKIDDVIRRIGVKRVSHTTLRVRIARLIRKDPARYGAEKRQDRGKGLTNSPYWCVPDWGADLILTEMEGRP